MKKKFIWIKNNIFMIILILSVPFIIIQFLHLGNFISAQTGINLNPSGVGNTEWFLFWAAYIGGICTLIAFLSTIKQNQRELQYNTEMHSIEREQEIMSNVIERLHIRASHDFFTKYLAIEEKDLLCNPLELSKLINLIVDMKKRLIIDNQTLIFNIEAYEKKCKKCPLLKKCSLGQASNKFVDSYDKLYKIVFDSIVNVCQCMQNIKSFHDINNREAKFVSLQKAQVSAKSSVKLEELRLAIFKMKKKEIMAEQDLSFDKVKKFLEKMEDYEHNEKNILLSSAKGYIMIRKKIANARLAGEAVPVCTSIEEEKKAY